MVKQKHLIEYLNELLQVNNFEDYCTNGLQVEGREEINSILCGVSVSQRLFEEALERGADAILVHHGLFWKSSPWMEIRGLRRRRLEILLKNGINLLAYHLPLDAHPVHGNNARIATLLGLSICEPLDVGFVVEASEPMSRDQFMIKLNANLGPILATLPFGSDSIRRVGIISGGASRDYRLAFEAGCDTYISGEISENVVREVEEVCMNYYALGHYNSERWGPLSLAEYLPKAMDVQAEFIDIPNPA